MSELVQNRKEKNRNFLPAFILTILWWGILGAMFITLDPTVVADFPIANSYGIFFLFLFLALWFTASLLFAHTRRGLIIALGGVIWGYLRIWHLGNLINTFLLIALLVALELYFSYRTI